MVLRTIAVHNLPYTTFVVIRLESSSGGFKCRKVVIHLHGIQHIRVPDEPNVHGRGEKESIVSSKEHNPPLEPTTEATTHQISRDEEPGPDRTWRDTDLSTAISRNQSHLPLASIPFPTDGTIPDNSGSEYGSSAFSLKSLKALSNLKWVLMSSNVTSCFLISLVTTLNADKSRLVLEDT